MNGSSRILLLLGLLSFTSQGKLHLPLFRNTHKSLVESQTQVVEATDADIYSEEV